VLATMAMMLVLGPLSYWQFGLAGLTVVGCFAIAMIASVLLASWGAAKLSHKHELIARLFASSGIRMVAPMIIALVVVATGGRIAPVESVYYVLPLYMCMMIVDVVGWVREVKSSVPNSTGRTQRGPAVNGKVG
jgi:hypothetical protein